MSRCPARLSDDDAGPPHGLWTSKLMLSPTSSGFGRLPCALQRVLLPLPGGGGGGGGGGGRGSLGGGRISNGEMVTTAEYRDRGWATSPFLPRLAESQSTLAGMLLMLPLHLLLVAVRLPLLAGALAAYFLVLQWLPIGPLGKKACLWSILGIPGIWWIDLQIDGVRKGSLGKQTATRLPQAGSVIASSFTSPIDALYLAAIFDPVFTVSYPSTQEVRQISLLEAILRAFARPEIHPHTRPHHLSSLFTSLGSLLFFIFSLLPSELAWLPPRPSTPPPPQLVTLEQLLQRYPDRAIAVFPECTPTNGNGILRLSPSLVGAGASRPIYPVSLRYTPADITTPVPDSYVSFLWHLLRKPTHCIRVRIAEQIVVPPAASAITAGGGVGAGGTEPSLRPFPGELGSVARRQQLLLEPKLCLDIQGNTADVLKVVNGAEQAPSLHPLLQRRCGERGVGRDSSVEAQLNSAQRELLNQVSDSLARLARVRRVALGAREKIAFVDAFARNGGRMVA